MKKEILKNIQNTAIFKGFSLKKNIIDEILENLKNQKFLVNREKNNKILLSEKKKTMEFIFVDI